MPTKGIFFNLKPDNLKLTEETKAANPNPKSSRLSNHYAIVYLVTFTKFAHNNLGGHGGLFNYSHPPRSWVEWKCIVTNPIMY